MSTICDIFQQAQLAEAAYADFSDSTKSSFDALTTGDSKFSTSQATDFLVRWKVIGQYTAPSSFFGHLRGQRRNVFQFSPPPIL